MLTLGKSGRGQQPRPRALSVRGLPRRTLASTAHPQTQLLRDYIKESLYHPTKGYFSSKARLFASPDAEGAIPFADLRHEADYHLYLSKLRKSQPNSWRTPTSVFGRLYTDAIGRYVASAWSRKDPLRIVEIGPGNGICAGNVLNFLKGHHPTLFASVHYQCVEVSPKFSSRLATTLAPFGKRASVTNMDFLEWREPSKAPVFIVGLEILDNLPHDRVVIKDGQWYETHVVRKSAQKADFIEVPLVDPAIKQTISLSKCVRSHHREVFVPTGALFLLQTIGRCFPEARLLLADFDHFPDQLEGPSSASKNVPSIHYSANGRSVEFASIPDAPTYGADIYFPTNFDDLKLLATAVLKKDTAPTIYSNEEFMKKFQPASEILKAETQSGYNPLLQDYANTKFFTL